MTKRIALLTALILLLVLLPGCPPGSGSALVGSWTITFNTLDWGLQINTDGTAVPFQIGGGILLGAFTWEIDGSRVLFHQENMDVRTIYAAELTSDTTMQGAFVRWAGSSLLGDSDTFTAVKQ